MLQFTRSKITILLFLILTPIPLAALAAEIPVSADTDRSQSQVLIFPYYTVTNNFITSFNIRNTRNDYKVIRLRFRESKFSNDVLDFNVYLSPFDVYALVLSQNDNGNVIVTFPDFSCTEPPIPDSRTVEFVAIYDNISLADTHEGYLEVIESATISNPGLQSGIKHNTNGIPNNCSIIQTAWDNGTFTQGGASAATQDGTTPANVDPPTGGLVGQGYLININTGSAYVQEATGIANYSLLAQHYRPGSPTLYLLPSLASGSNRLSSVPNAPNNEFLFRTWPLAPDAGLTDTNTAPNPPVPSGNNPYPISTVLAIASLNNEYITEESILSSTDFIVTMPMKKHGILNQPLPFLFEYFDREEQRFQRNPGFSPPIFGNLSSFLREVNVITLAHENTPASPVLGATDPIPIEILGKFDSGWATVIMTDDFSANVPLSDPTDTGWNRGVPAIGIAAFRGTIDVNRTKVVGEAAPHAVRRLIGITGVGGATTTAPPIDLINDDTGCLFPCS